MPNTSCDHLKPNSDSDVELEKSIAKELGITASRQELFDKFLTYRRRMARLSAVQAIYLYDVRSVGEIAGNKELFSNNKDEVFSVACNDVISLYKTYFFDPQEYGWTKKNKKIDEEFMFALVANVVSSTEEIDEMIQNRLSGTWTTDKLDVVLRSIIRCAVAEIMLGNQIEKAVLCSEYTNIASNFFSSKEIGFVNGIVDKLYGDVVKVHPFL